MPQSPFQSTIARFLTLSGSWLQRQPEQDAQNALFTAARHGRNYEQAAKGVMGFAANQTGATTSAGLATTYTGLCLSNPANSGKSLALVNVSGSLNVAPAALTGFNLIIGYAAAGIVTHTTPLTVQNAQIGASAAGLVGLADAACTLVGTPAFAMPLGETPGATSVTAFNVDIGGGIILPPGAYAAIGTTIAGPAAGLFGGFVWEEVPALT